MHRKCDKCDRPATNHSVEILKGQKIEKHLCDLHASEEGMAIKGSHTPINELLTNFVKLHSGGSSTPASEGSAKRRRGSSIELTCDACGMSFSEFRESSLVGCSECYRAFEGPLGPMLERAHEGGSHHIGKVPRRAGAGEQRQAQLMRMRQRLDEAVAGEDYELAARLRDDIRKLEEQAE